MLKRLLIGLVVVVALGVAAFAALAWRSEIDPIDPPAVDSFDPELIQRGEELALAGDCNRCHTRPGGEPYAGGYPLHTPFGTIYATNITPDAETGIGRWSEEALIRAMHEGVDREGRHLYPAFPYDFFHLVSEDDIRAIYAFLMTREPVSYEAPANELPFPLNVRPILAGWKLLFLDEGAYQPDSGQSEEWNRGAYLVDGLGHCGACHTPRNLLMAVQEDEAFEGGLAEGWHGPALDETSPAPVPWNADSIFAYLRQGWHEHHGVAAGPMEPVTANLAAISEADVRAIAVYMASIAGEPDLERRERAEALIAQTEEPQAGAVPASADSQAPVAPTAITAEAEGGLIYAGACGTCHEAGRPLPLGGMDLALSTSVHTEDARNFLQFTMNGVHPPAGETGAIMPGYSGALTDAQLADLAAYVRARYSAAPAWENVEDIAAEIRQEGEGS